MVRPNTMTASGGRLGVAIIRPGREGRGTDGEAFRERGGSMKVPQWLLKARERTERILKDFEWSWTKAVVFSLGFGFFCLITMAVIPSFWMYFAEQTLGWDGLSGTEDWRPLARDAVAMGLATGPFITVVIAATILQNWRRKLRGAAAEGPAPGVWRARGAVPEAQGAEAE